MKIIWLIFSAVSWAEMKNLQRLEQRGSLSRLAASPLDFASALCSNFQKKRIDFKFTYDRFVRATRSTCVRIFPTASQLSQLTSPSPSLRNSTLKFQHSGETFVRSKHIVLNRSWKTPVENKQQEHRNVSRFGG